MMSFAAFQNTLLIGLQTQNKREEFASLEVAKASVEGMGHFSPSHLLPFNKLSPK